MTFCRSSINRYTHIYVGIYINSTKLCVRIYYSIIDNIIIIRFGYVCFCKCSVAKAFLEASVTTKFDYFIGITTYVHMTSEHVVYRPTSTLDKLIIFDVPLYTGTTWTQLGAVPLTEMLVFLDDYPNFIVRCTPPSASQLPFSPGAASAYLSPQPPTPSSPFSDAAYYPLTPTPPPTHPNSFNRV